LTLFGANLTGSLSIREQEVAGTDLRVRFPPLLYRRRRRSLRPCSCFSVSLHSPNDKTDRVSPFRHLLSPHHVPACNMTSQRMWLLAGLIDEWFDGGLRGMKAGWMDRWMDGWMDGCIVGRGGSVMGLMPCSWKVTGSSPTLSAM